MFTTIPEMFTQVCDRYKGRTDKFPYTERVSGEWKSITHDQLRSNVELLAAGLHDLGIRKGDRVGIISENRTEWFISDFAMVGLGIIDVPVFPTLTPKQLQYIYHDCDAVCVIVSNQLQLNKLRQVWDDLPMLRHIITMNDVECDDERVLTMKSVMQKAESTTTPQHRHDLYVSTAAQIKPDDLLTLIYTSGTTGNPKGVMLTHNNLVSNVLSSQTVITLYDTDSLVSYLPLCHIFERMAGFYLAFSVGGSLTIAESIDTVAELMRQVRPTMMTSVPRLFERIRLRILSTVEKDKPIKQKIFRWAYSVGEAVVDGKGGPLVGLQHALADKLVFSKIRERFGGRLRFFVSGGAALNPEIGRFFQVFGIKIVEGYGLTESSPVISVHRLEDIALGTVGTPIPGVEVKIADDGEILARGPNIMRGYWRNEEETDKSVDSEGWLHTGDIGEFNSRGHLRITDRKKHLLVSSGGKNIAPQPIEALIAQCPFVDQVMLVGDAREYCTALLVLDKEAAKAWAEKNAVVSTEWEELVGNPSLRSTVEKEINRLQRDLSKFEKVRRFAIIPESFSVENGMLTPTLKVKRKAVLERYADIVDSLYEQGE
ncbi:MAG: long-chain fatty acid--CoA ligase [Candidatus Kapabacteria bacterium]|nr:long-chain fatty acid--CoA ligase [Candidatus Kapabacteria bacterium]